MRFGIMATAAGPGVSGAPPSSGLSAEQLRRIEENRHRARERLAGRAHSQPSRNAQTSSFSAPLTNVCNKLPHNRADFQGNGGQFGVKSNLTSLDGYPSSSSLRNGATSASSVSQKQPVPAVRKCVELVRRPTVRANLRLMSKQRFEIVLPYDKLAIDVCKKTPTNAYNAKSAIWCFGIEVYDKLALQRECKHIELSQIPRPVVSLFQSIRPGKRGVESGIWNGMEPKLTSTLMQFQREGIEFCIGCEGRALLADDMGLGKTLQALAVMSYYRGNWPLLIICPSSVRMTWAEACQRWLSDLREDDLSVVVTGRLPSAKCPVTIISYDLASRLGTELAQRKPDAIIVDESHFLKNYKTNRCKAILPLIKSATRCLLLSGTPALSRPIELYTQISALDRSFRMSLVNFGIRYCSAVKNHFGWDFSGASNLNELHLYMQEKFMIRRLKNDVLDQLPMKRRQTVVLDPSLTKTQSREARELRQELEKAGMCKAMNRHNALLPLFEKTGRLKLPAVRGYIQDLLEGGRKLIVFAHHKSVLDSISECLLDKGYEHIRIDGRTPAESRQLLCDRFQHDDTCLVALLSITTANAGLTLTASSTVVFAELFWNPGILVQAEDRAYRIGQKNSVVIHYLVARETVDDFIWPLIQNKLTVLSKAGLAVDDFSSSESTVLKSTGLQKTLLDFLDKEQTLGDSTATVSGNAETESEPASSSRELRSKRKRPATMLEDHGFSVQGKGRPNTKSDQSTATSGIKGSLGGNKTAGSYVRDCGGVPMSKKSKSTDLASYLLSRQVMEMADSDSSPPLVHQPVHPKLGHPPLHPKLGQEQASGSSSVASCSYTQHTMGSPPGSSTDRASSVGSGTSSTVDYSTMANDGGDGEYDDDWLLNDCDLASFDNFDDDIT